MKWIHIQNSHFDYWLVKVINNSLWWYCSKPKYYTISHWYLAVSRK